MIDEDKIKDAAYDMNDGGLTNDKLMRGGFVRGAQWAQAEFVNSLWHDASEEPKKGEQCLVDMEFLYEDAPEDRTFTTSTYGERGWTEDYMPNSAKYFKLHRWCYISDILPKKGGEE